jgi:hypothetical protein
MRLSMQLGVEDERMLLSGVGEHAMGSANSDLR